MNLLKKWVLPFNFFNILIASPLSLGFEITIFSKSITLSAPSTILSFAWELTLFAFNSARFFDIISGDAPCFTRFNFIGSSSRLEGLTSQDIPF